jgi:hypothetical protein
MFFYEHKGKPLIPKKIYYRRLLNNFLIASLIITFSLIIGVAGYMLLAHFSFVDALLNASMILGGMGPVNALPDDASKYFASVYALFSGITFLTTVAVLLAPVLHRIMHRFHIETEEEEEEKKNIKRKQ